MNSSNNVKNIKDNEELKFFARRMSATRTVKSRKTVDKALAARLPKKER